MKQEQRKKSIRKIIAVFLVAGLIAALFPADVYAEENSSQKPDVTISNAKEWNQFAAKVRGGNTFEGKLVKMTKDIAFDESSILEFGPAGSKDCIFKGTFDGAGHTISGVDYAAKNPYEDGAYYYVDWGTKKYYTNVEVYIALFPKVSGTIQNLMLMYGKEASNRKQEIDCQYHTIPNQRPKDKHYGNVHNRLFRHG